MPRPLQPEEMGHKTPGHQEDPTSHLLYHSGHQLGKFTLPYLMKTLPLDYSTKLHKHLHFEPAIPFLRIYFTIWNKRYLCRVTCWCILSNHKILVPSVAPASRKLIKDAKVPIMKVCVRRREGGRTGMVTDYLKELIHPSVGTKIMGNPVTCFSHC